MLYILLPAYNEEKNIVKIFKKINKIKKKISPFKVVLIDDCSNDNTKKLTKKNYNFDLIYKRHKKNKGLSLTLETGFKLIRNKAKKNDIIITLDSDNTHPVEKIIKMIQQINNSNDIIIASRFQTESKVKGVSIFRNFMSLGAKFLFKIFYSYKNLNDYTCNFRAYKFYLINNLLKNNDFFKNEDFNIAAKIIIFLITKYNFIKIKEIPFNLGYDLKIGKSKMNIVKTILLTLKLIFFKKIY
tara:strand:- start:3559 stop:4284 length:726 start_codon:yes stop_codon:yes gene_type:complete